MGEKQGLLKWSLTTNLILGAMAELAVWSLHVQLIVEARIQFSVESNTDFSLKIVTHIWWLQNRQTTKKHQVYTAIDNADEANGKIVFK